MKHKALAVLEAIGNMGWDWLIAIYLVVSICMVYLFFGVFNEGGMTADSDRLITGIYGMLIFTIMLVVSGIALFCRFVHKILNTIRNKYNGVKDD